ncbi:AgmX/PglI C-terminal domain-containing protein [Polyangium sp. y55x31]|uniref:AgmX/PglI C-terminal domain-containing protein n=1 Tax=Polyangium sp. y55x31 TaxID=3042688 RepID=UPI00248222C1|nr:AgmX/PglI C-terminal domain-containing protein [Polyangium sp. y55x31]MDI1477034.1 AgmX/PglI C-terminal domain-containing protein [Polyangium sp. y55x31]
MDHRNEKKPALDSNNPFVAKAPVDLFGATQARPFDPRALFADKASEPEIVAADAPEGSYTYALVKSGPEVPAEECERADEAVEIMILWGDSILHVAHLSPVRPFHVGEENADFVIPAATLGASHLPVVLVGADGKARVVVPATAKASIETEGRRAPVDATNAMPCAALAGSVEVALSLGARVKVEIGGLSIQVASVKAGRKVKGGAVAMQGKGLSWHGVSLAVHAGLLAAAAFFLPPLGATDEDAVSDEDKYFIQHALDVSAEREEDKKETPELAENNEKSPGGSSGARAQDSEGKMGSTTSRKSEGRFALAGDKNNTDPQIARQAAIDEARTFGMIGMLNTMNGGDPNAITAKWGGDTTFGSDERSALGNMWGPSIGEAAGSGGLGLSGHEEGGGGKGEGIGIDRINTIGSNLGGMGGFNRNLKPKDHKTSAPVMRPQGITTTGRLPAEIIQRTVRQNFGRFRFCYEQGLRQNPNLQGRVAVRFVIGRDGSVSQVSNGGSDLPDQNTVSCVVRSFYGMSFPAPEDGIVTVTYPIMFQPGS